VLKKQNNAKPTKGQSKLQKTTGRVRDDFRAVVAIRGGSCGGVKNEYKRDRRLNLKKRRNGEKGGGVTGQDPKNRPNQTKTRRGGCLRSYANWQAGGTDTEKNL